MKKVILLTLILVFTLSSFLFAGQKEDLAIKIVTLQQELQIMQEEFKAKSDQLLKLQEEFKKLLKSEKQPEKK
jgi:ABC-type uncharacterized transport system auxiliary subunit